jgi:hypothetical protein
MNAIGVLSASKAGEHPDQLIDLLQDASEQLYPSLGYQRASVIPRYARSASGLLHHAVFFYRENPL